MPVWNVFEIKNIVFFQAMQFLQIHNHPFMSEYTVFENESHQVNKQNWNGVTLRGQNLSLRCYQCLEQNSC